MSAAKVQILLATYNGEKYLEEQLDSIKGQTFQDWEILARDDGSRDNTVGILSKFRLANPGKMTILNDNSQNLGFARNFMRLADASTSDIVCFSDQDDIWDANKVERSVAELEAEESKHGHDEPVLVHHDVRMIGALPPKAAGESYHQYFRIAADHTPVERLLLMNAVHGMSMTTNRALIKRALPQPEYIESHDQYLGLIARVFGHLTYVPETMAQYRIHGNNTSAVASYMQINLQSIFESRSNVTKKIQARADAAGAFVIQHGSEMPADVRDAFVRFSELPQQGWISRKRQLLNSGLLQVANERSLAFLLHG